MFVRGNASGIDLRHARDHGAAANWFNLNGLWEWQPATGPSPVPTGQTLNGSILVTMRPSKKKKEKKEKKKERVSRGRHRGI
jgi:hypothetical protein